MSAKGTVFDLQRSSVHDGPGIRTVIFFKGCPLRCLWCQNPEGLDPGVDIAFSQSRCLNCRECESVCPLRVIVFDEQGRVNRQLCDRCGRCVDVCYAEALQIIGRSYTPIELLEEAIKDMPFFVASGGGITLSGGEPTYQAEFLSGFLSLCREKGVHVALETCGYVAFDNLEPLLPLVDLVLYDIKAIDPFLHLAWTGKDNAPILENLRRILYEDASKVSVRVPLVPGLTATDRNLTDIIYFLKRHKVARVTLLPYHKMGEGKLEKIDSPLRPLNLTAFSESDLLSICDLFNREGIEVGIGG